MPRDLETTASDVEVGNETLSLDGLANLPIWLAWQESESNKKVPWDPNNRKAASSTNPNTWAVRSKAERRARGLIAKRPKGIGLALGPHLDAPGLRLIGIDLDGCRDHETGEVADWAQAVIDEFDSYTEISPSGSGLHVLALCSEVDFGALLDDELVTKNGAAEFSVGDHVEIALFGGGRYFTFTNDPLNDGKDLRIVDQENLRWLTLGHGPAFKQQFSKPMTGGSLTEDYRTGGKDGSGSGVAFRFLLGLARKGYSEEDARDLIETDGGDAGAWWHRTDLRQQDRAVQRAFAEVQRQLNKLILEFDDITDDDFSDIDERIEWELGIIDRPSSLGPIEVMSKRHAVVALGNRTAVATFHKDRVDFCGSSDLKLLYRNELVGGRSIADVWLEHRRRRTYPGGVVFNPGTEADPGVLNLWQGWAIEPDAQASCQRILRHVQDVICAGDRIHFDYLIGWLADLFQNPGRKPRVAIVLRGLKGTGKDTLAEVLKKIIGKIHVAHIDHPDRLTAKFNAHLGQAIFVHVEEAFWAGGKDKKGTLQALITSPTTTLEKKGVDAVTVDSFVRLLMTTNETWAVPATADERRYAVFDVAPAKMGDTDYFDRLYREIEGRGAAAFLHYLLNVDLTNFRVTEVPQTNALLDQKIATLGNIDRWWFDLLWQGEAPDFSGFDGPDWSKLTVTLGRAAVRAHYETSLAKMRFDNVPLDEREFGKELRRLCPEIKDKRVKEGDGRVWSYAFPPLQRCQELFSEHLGGDASAIEWPALDVH